MTPGSIVVVGLVVASWAWCLVVAGNHPEGVARQRSLESIDLAHPIDGPLVLDRLAATDDHKEDLNEESDGNKFPRKTKVRESDFEREKRREMEIAREREQKGNAGRRDQITTKKETLFNGHSRELDRQREVDRQKEILREIRKAEERKRELLQRTTTIPLHAREANRFISAHDSTHSSKGEHISLQRQIDRSLRGGDVVDDKFKPQRSTMRDDGDSGWSRSYLKAEHVHREESRRKPPILILEQVPVRYPDSETRSEESHGDGYSDNEDWSGSDRRFVDSSRWTTLVDSRAPDRPVILPRPGTATVDRRPDRPDYPYRYDEISLATLDDPAKHLEDLVDHRPIGETGPRQSLLHHASYNLPHDIEGLNAAAQADAANLHLALEQALIAEHTLHTQAIQAGKIKQAAVAAHLVNQAAAHRLATQQLAAQAAAQQLAAQKAAVQQFVVQKAAAHQLAAQKTAAHQLAAQKTEAQRIAAGTAASNLKAAQLGHIAAGNEAIKAAIKTNLESEISHRLKKLIPQDPLARVLSGGGVGVQVGGIPATAPFTPNLQHLLILGSQQIQQMRQELLHRLSLLK